MDKFGKDKTILSVVELDDEAITVVLPTGVFYTKEEMLKKIGSHLTEEDAWELKTFQSDVYYFKERTVRSGTFNFGMNDEFGMYIPEIQEHLMFRYRVLAVIASSKNGQVLHCWDHMSGEEVAIKILLHNAMLDEDEYENEREMYETLQSAGGSPNIIHFLNSFFFRGHFCFVFKLLFDGDLKEHMQTFQTGLPMEKVRQFTSSILRGLLHLKNVGIVHGNLKPSNILLVDRAAGNVCLSNFKLSTWEADQCQTLFCAEQYLSPEVLLGQRVTCATNMWNLACIATEMAMGSSIFRSPRKERLAEFIKVFGLPPENIVDKSHRMVISDDHAVVTKVAHESPLAKQLQQLKNDQFLDFINRCFAWDPAQRLTPQEALEHPWVTGSGPAAPPPLAPPVASLSPPETSGDSSDPVTTSEFTTRILHVRPFPSSEEAGVSLSPPETSGDSSDPVTTSDFTTGILHVRPFPSSEEALEEKEMVCSTRMVPFEFSSPVASDASTSNDIIFVRPFLLAEVEEWEEVEKQNEEDVQLVEEEAEEEEKEQEKEEVEEKKEEGTQEEDMVDEEEGKEEKEDTTILSVSGMSIAPRRGRLSRLRLRLRAMFCSLGKRCSCCSTRVLE